jgi:hypothetical protein
MKGYTASLEGARWQILTHTGNGQLNELKLNNIVTLNLNGIIFSSSQGS